MKPLGTWSERIAGVAGIARLAIAAPRRVIAVALLLLVGTALFGIPVINNLSAGGMRDPASESSQAAKFLSEKFDQGDMDMLITVTADGGVHSAAAQAVGSDIVAQLRASPFVGQVTPPWTVPLPVASSLISKDGKTGLMVAGITGGENEAQKHAKTLAAAVVHDRDAVTVRAGGTALPSDRPRRRQDSRTAARF